MIMKKSPIVGAVLLLLCLEQSHSWPQFSFTQRDDIDKTGTEPFQRTTSTTPTPSPARPSTTTTTTTTTPTTDEDEDPPALPPLSQQELANLPPILNLLPTRESSEDPGGLLQGLLDSLFKPQTGNVNPEVTAGHSQSINDFAFSFLAEMLKSEANTNFVFSPFSLHVTLAMLASGATVGSSTQEELLNAMGRSRNIRLLEETYKTLLAEYKTLQSTFLFGNRLWVPQDELLNIWESYQMRLHEVYQSEIALLPRSQPEAAINQWVATVTKGKIDKLFDQLSANVQLVLTNAMYFKDAWTVPFRNETDPSKRLFNLVNGATRANVPMMNRESAEFKAVNFTFDNDNRRTKFLAVSIPYKYDQGDRFEMVLVTPTHKVRDFVFLQDSFRRSAASGSHEKNAFDVIDEALKSVHPFNSTDINLTMPLFKVQAKVDVKKILSQLGVNGIFDEGSFNRISAVPLVVGDIKSKAVIEVDQQGTEGAVATGLDLVPFMAGALPTDVTIDKPFLFIIRDKVKNVPLFVGSIVDPVAAAEQF